MANGWNRPGAAVKGRDGKSPLIWRGVMAGAAVVVAGCALLWYALSDDRTIESRTAKPRTMERQGKEPIVADIRPKSLPQAIGEEVRNELKMPKPSGKHIDKRVEVTAPQPLEELQAAVTNTHPKGKVAFKNGAEQLLSLATPSEPGGRVPPLPPITDESIAKELAEAMEHVVKAEDGDSDSTLERKMTVIEAKEQFRDLRDNEGYTFTEYLNALRDQANLDADFLTEAHKMAEELYHDETISDENYVKYREQINNNLRVRGLPEIE